MVINLKRAVIVRKAIEYAAIAIIVTLITWFASCNNSCKRSPDLVQNSQRDSLSEAEKDSLRTENRRKDEIILGLLMARQNNQHDEVNRKTEHKQKLKIAENEINKMSDDSLHRSIIDKLSRYSTDK
jgi:hypothetical protein